MAAAVRLVILVILALPTSDAWCFKIGTKWTVQRGGKRKKHQAVQCANKGCCQLERLLSEWVVCGGGSAANASEQEDDASSVIEQRRVGASGGAALWNCKELCARRDGCRSARLSENHTCLLSSKRHEEGRGWCRVVDPASSGGETDRSLVVLSSLLNETSRLTSFSRGRSYRYMSLIDLGGTTSDVGSGGGIVLVARDGEFPSASPGERLVTWPPSRTPDLEGVRLANQAASAPSLVYEDGASAAGGLVESVAHNFAFHLDAGGTDDGAATLSVCGGRIARELKKPDGTGVVCATAATRGGASSAGGGIFGGGGDAARGAFTVDPTVLLRADHAGCVEHVMSGGCKYNSKLSIARLGGRLLVYARMNTDFGRRFVQVADADSLKGPFGPFRPLELEDPRMSWHDCSVRHASIYYVSVVDNPARPGTLLGIFPVNLGGRDCFVALAASCDGTRFSRLDPILSTRCTPGGRVADLPIDGVVVRQDALYLYVHRDMPTFDAVETPSYSPGIVRHTVPLAALRRWTDAAIRNSSFSARCPPSPPTDHPRGGVAESAAELPPLDASFSAQLHRCFTHGARPMYKSTLQLNNGRSRLPPDHRDPSYSYGDDWDEDAPEEPSAPNTTSAVA